MRWLAVLLLFVTLARAEENFGPLALYQDDWAYVSQIRFAAPNQIECLWGPLSIPGMPGMGYRTSPAGEPQGDTLHFLNLGPGNFTCPAEMEITATHSGGEARIIGHT